MKLHNRKGKISAGFYMVWSLPSVCCAVAVVIINYISYYATNVLGMSAAMIGMLILASKIFDGFTDIVAGFIVDKTRTKLGKARPYDLAYFFYYLFGILLFTVPVMSEGATAVYVFVMYTMTFSVFQTLYSTANTVYLARAVESSSDRVSLTSVQGILTMVFAVAIGIIAPQLVKAAGADRGAWSRMAMAVMIPCMILSFLRILLIKEERDDNTSAAVDFTVFDGARMLFKNKYCMIIGVVMLISNIAGNLTSNVSSYYFQYVFGDIGLASIVAMTALATPVALIFAPALIKKIGLGRLIRYGFIIMFICRLLPLLNVHNMVIITVGTLIYTIASGPISLLAGLLIIDCMDYGEWLNSFRGEGIYAIVVGFASKVGLGIASGLVGLILALGGFDGLAAQQTASAVNAIIALNTWLPAIGYAVGFILMCFYDLDEKLPGIRTELDKKHEALYGD